MKIVYNKNLKLLARNLRNNPTHSEVRMWKHLKGDAFYGYDFHRQKPIGNYIVDFYCHQLRLVIEIDGITHNYDDVIEKDKIRDNYLHSLGLTVMRISAYNVIQDIQNTLRAIENYILDYNTHLTSLDREEPDSAGQAGFPS
jgi:very-short-patch-repair endonuclease